MASVGKVSAAGDAVTKIRQLKKKPAARVGKVKLHADGNAKARATRRNWADVGEIRAKGIINPTDEELLLLIGMSA